MLFIAIGVIFLLLASMVFIGDIFLKLFLNPTQILFFESQNIVFIWKLNSIEI